MASNTKLYSKYKSDSKLISEIRYGCEKAFKSLFDKYHQKIYNVSRAMGISQEDSEGIVQEVFITVWEKRLHLDVSLSINSYMLTIAKRLVYKKFRYAVIRRAHEAYARQTNPKSNNATEDYIIFSDLNEVAKKGIDQLPESRKQIFMLSKEHGLTNDEIAEKLHISKRTVENQLYRATNALKDHISRSQSSS